MRNYRFKFIKDLSNKASTRINVLRIYAFLKFFLLSFSLVTLSNVSLAKELDANSLPSLNEFTPENYKRRERHQAVNVLSIGSGADRSFVFIPDQPFLQKRPLIIFLHGWMGTNPKNYGAIIDHLVRQGSVVIYPVYQTDGKTIPQGITDTALKSLTHTLGRIDLEFPGLIDRENTLYYGFSMGATMAINLAMDAKRGTLPLPKALLLSAPGDAHHVAHGPLAESILKQSIHQLPIELPIVLMSGKEDTTIGVPTAYQYWNQICSQERLKTLILWPAGKTEGQAIGAGHGAPGAPDERYDFPDTHADVTLSIPRTEQFPVSKSINNLDFYGQWKILNGWIDHLLKGQKVEWMFSRNAVTQDLGRFENNQPYPLAEIETQCPATWVAPEKKKVAAPAKKTSAKVKR